MFLNNKCNARIKNIEAKGNGWPIFPCGSAISVVGEDSSADSSVSVEQMEYLVPSAWTSYKGNVHSAVYARKGAKMKSDYDSFSNNTERDKEDIEILADILCEDSQVVVQNPQKVHPQRLCDEVCGRRSKTDAAAVKCEFFPAEDVRPSCVSVVFKRPYRLPLMELRGKNVYTLHEPILWIGKSERTSSSSNASVTAE